MKYLKLIFAAAFPALLLLACSGAASDKATSTTGSSDPGGASSTGKDMYYEYTSTAGSNKMTIKTDTKMYVSSSGDTRVEMTMENSAMRGKGPVTIVTIGHSSKPNESISIDDSAKTYSVNHFNDSDLTTGEKIKSSATKIGEDNILGFSSVHARIISDKSAMGIYFGIDTIDLWRSNAVPMQASVKALMDKFNSKAGMTLYSPEVENQLKQMGCEGFMTKLEMHSKNVATTETLVKVEHRDLPSRMFEIPAGYKETKDGIGE